MPYPNGGFNIQSCQPQIPTYSNLAKFEGDAEPDHICLDIVAIFENGMTDSDGIIPYGLVAGKTWLVGHIELTAERLDLTVL
jgi:hypothetical protein